MAQTVKDREAAGDYTPVSGLADDDDDMRKEPSAERRSRLMKQVGLFLLTTIGHINWGMGLSWPNTIAADMQDDNSTLLGYELSLSDWELDMTGSFIFIGTLPGFLFGGWLVARLGRRRSMMVVVLPCVIGWSFVAFSINSSMLFIGRFISGAAYALLVVAVRTYLSEIADTSIRGAAILSAECMKSLGAILIVTVGMLGSWYYLAFFCACEIIFFGLIVVPFLPESPTYLTVTGKDDEARKVLRRLRGRYVDIEKEIGELKKQNERRDGSSGWGVLLKPDIMKKCLIVFGLFGISNFCGTEVIKANAVRILQTSGLSLGQDFSTIIVFVLLLGGNIFQTVLVDRIGRRKCLVLSLVLLVIAYTILGTYVYIDTAGGTAPSGDIRSDADNSWKWVPTACLMVCAFSSSIGIGPTPWMLSVEYFPTSIRSQVMSVCTFFGSLMSFSSLQVYSPLQNALTPAGLYWSYACFSVIGIIYTMTIVQDTTGQKVG